MIDRNYVPQTKQNVNAQPATSVPVAAPVSSVEQNSVTHVEVPVNQGQQGF